ncbi:hypothetical protein CCACVL1_04791 [Corchorus capsularis]|uniref:Protein kinase domain-containing protein n=1 Tax=Corchorus capsularis TaxID=210143 RepID=A0A1R3JPX1_COCAP|nr:hypothetical protein CCACVL1_04791 [Corchorus capsularis]
MILKGLVEIHSKKYVHSDLKTANILVFRTEDCSGLPVLKIADFGLTKVSGVEDTLGVWFLGYAALYVTGIYSWRNFGCFACMVIRLYCYYDDYGRNGMELPRT